MLTLPPRACPSPVFTSNETWNGERIAGLAVYCSDGRWGEAFDDFCQHHLRMPRYDRWAVPGGPLALVPHPHNTAYCRATWEQLDFLARAHGLRRIVLIAHHGCAAYGAWLGRDPAGCLPQQLADLRTARDALREWFAPIEVETYLAARQGGRLSFYAADDATAG